METTTITDDKEGSMSQNVEWARKHEQDAEQATRELARRILRAHYLGGAR